MPLFGFLSRLSRRRNVAEELLEETWLRLVTNARRLRPDTRLAPWLFTVARNLYWSYCRSRLPCEARTVELIDLWPLADDRPSPFEVAAAGGTRAPAARAGPRRAPRPPPRGATARRQRGAHAGRGSGGLRCDAGGVPPASLARARGARGRAERFAPGRDSTNEWRADVMPDDLHTDPLLRSLAGPCPPSTWTRRAPRASGRAAMRCWSTGNGGGWLWPSLLPISSGASSSPP